MRRVVELLNARPDQAMIFVFQNPSPQNFWMHNTLVDLDIAYIGTDKKVIKAATMKKLNDNTTPSGGPAQYALEMKAGTIARLGIAKGTRVDIPADLKALE